MNRRLFLASMAAAGSALRFWRTAFGQEILPMAQPQPLSAARQSQAIRTCASAFLQSLAPNRRDRITFDFPTGQVPTAIGFSSMPGRHGGPGGPDRQRRNLAFDTDGRPTYQSPADHEAFPGRGRPLGGGHHGLPPAAGEKFGQAVWTNFPVDNVARPGVRMGEFTATERAAAHGFLQTVLSPMGYRKILDIMEADQKVADAGSDYAAGLDVYTLGIFGSPSSASPWMLQFGGHHLGLNVVFVGDKAVCSPLHTGILPARFETNGTVMRGLGRENDKAFDLIATFTPDQFEAAAINHEVSELVFGPGHPDAELAPQGLLGADMNKAQLQMMFGLIAEWAGMLNDAHAASRLAEIRASLSGTRFAWSGPTKHEAGHNGEAYFRIHSPSLVIEHAPQGNQGGYKVHVHTVMRDLHNDYARQLV